LLAALERHFPAVAPAYARVHGAVGAGGGARYTPRWQTEQVQARVQALKETHGLAGRQRPTPAPISGGSGRSRGASTPSAPEQLALPW
jgi:hypothetical protein